MNTVLSAHFAKNETVTEGHGDLTSHTEGGWTWTGTLFFWLTAPLLVLTSFRALIKSHLLRRASLATLWKENSTPSTANILHFSSGSISFSLQPTALIMILYVLSYCCRLCENRHFGLLCSLLYPQHPAQSPTQSGCWVFAAEHWTGRTMALSP